MRDLDFISGKFFDYDIPRDQQYLLKYFTTDVQVAFLRYYLVFGDSTRFTDHTGHYCCPRLRFRLMCRVRKLTKLHAEAKKSLTEQGLAMLQLLESGQHLLTGRGIS